MQNSIILQSRAKLNTAQIEMNRSNAEVLQLKRASAATSTAVTAPAPVPAIVTLPGLNARVTIQNVKGETILVDPCMFIHPLIAGSISDVDKSTIPVPVLKMEKLSEMRPNDWVKFAASLANYYNVGGMKPITTFVDLLIIESLASTFGMEVSVFTAMTTQL